MPKTIVGEKTRTFIDWRSLLRYAGFLAIVYFGNNQIQTWLGRQALEEVALEKRSLDQALSIATEVNKPVLLEISALWCPSCRKLDKQVLSQPEVQNAIEQSFVYAREELESEIGETLRQQFTIKGVPTLLILESTGELRQYLPLTFDPKHFIARLNQVR